MRFVLSGLVILIVLNCQNNTSVQQMDIWIQEIIDTEKAFADRVQAEGLHTAFVAFAAEDAVLLRGDQLIKGKMGIDEFYKGNHIKTLSWAPELVEVAASGELAYTYGPFTYTTVDSVRNTNEITGFFHTVWKRQEDGSWKYVWD